MSELLEHRRQMKRFIADNLTGCCAELVSWRDTALLKNGLVRQAAAIAEKIYDHDALKVVEREIEYQATVLVSAGPVAKPQVEFNDTFNGDNMQLVGAINALIKLDAAGALAPVRMPGHARTLLHAAGARLANVASAPGLTESKTNDIMRRGYQKVGYVLQNADGHYCVSSQSAVRWLDNSHMWRLMHEQDGKLFNTKPAPLWSDVLDVLRGIDDCKVSDADAWWETSGGAQFDAERLAELKKLFDNTQVKK